MSSTLHIPNTLPNVITPARIMQNACCAARDNCGGSCGSCLFNSDNRKLTNEELLVLDKIFEEVIANE